MIEQILGSISSLFWIFLIIIPLFLFKALLRSPRIKGSIGKIATRSVIRRNLGEKTYFEFHNLTIPSRDGAARIGHICVSISRIFVIGAKNYTGWIFDSERQSKWTQIIYRQKYYFQSLLRQNYVHTRALSELLQSPNEESHSMVIFLGDYELKSKMSPNVCRIRRAATYIEDFQVALLLPHEVKAVVAVLSSNDYQADSEKLRVRTKCLQRRYRR